VKTTVVIPTKNRPEDLLRACLSLCNQTAIPDLVIIVDQSVSDSSAVMISNLFKEYKINCNYISDSNISGLVKAKEFSIQYNVNDLIFFIEDDVELYNDYIEKMKLVFIENATIMGCCGVDVLNKYNKSYYFFHRLFHIGFFKDMRPFYISEFHVSNKEQLSNCNILSGGISAWRASVFKEINFDTLNYFHSIEDVVFSTRVRALFGINSMFINTSVKLKHFLSPKSRTSDLKSFTNKVYENVIFFKAYSNRSISDYFSLIVLLIGFFLHGLIKSLLNMNLLYAWYFFKGIKKAMSTKVVEYCLNL
jgi:GT2 family glycosyltransferase